MPLSSGLVRFLSLSNKYLCNIDICCHYSRVYYNEICKRWLILLSGALSGISMEVAPLQEARHCFSLFFLVPGEYTMVAAAVIEDANNVLRARAGTASPNEPIFCRGPPFHVCVAGGAL
jgi:hypothetical protein